MKFSFTWCLLSTAVVSTALAKLDPKTGLLHAQIPIGEPGVEAALAFLLELYYDPMHVQKDDHSITGIKAFVVKDPKEKGIARFNVEYTVETTRNGRLLASERCSDSVKEIREGPTVITHSIETLHPCSKLSVD